MDQGQATDTRRYEIDALRVIALVLLIIYHIFICYQSFAERIGFLQYDQSLEKYWFLGELLNIWRIPVLFVVSGMAVGFVVHRRTLPELLKDRLVRLVPPLLFGALVMVPLFALFGPLYRGEPLKYQPSPGHLWFVVNLVSYSILLIPLFFWIRRRPENGLIRSLRALFPWGLLLVFPLPLMVETALLKPFGFAFFPTRFWYGLACYVLGFLLVCVGDSFWSALRRVCHPALALAFLFYLGRMKVLGEGWFPDGQWIVAYESGMWMLAFLGYGSLLLNRKTRVFGYFNKAVFPIYIIHMPAQQLVAFGIYRWGLIPEVTFVLHVVMTLLLCGLVYEFLIKRVRWLHPVMGVKFAPAVVPADREEEEASPQPRRRWAKVAEILTVFVATPLIVLAQMGTVIAITASQFGRGEGGSLASDSIWEAAKENKIETLQSMLEEESRVNRKDPKFQLTALHWAAINGQSEAAALLLEAGAKVNARSGDQSTPLSQAAFMGNVETVALLLKHGAEVNPVNHHKTTPLDVTFADWSTVTWVTEMLDLNADREEWEKGRLEVRKLLIEHGGKHRSQLSG